MGHHISALIARAPVDAAAARALDLPVIEQAGYAIVALHPDHTDYWTDQLGLPSDAQSAMLHDCAVVHEFARRLAMTRYALIETDYFGGIGRQLACVRDGSRRVMETTEGGINRALAMLGVVCEEGMDEFDTIGLGRHRDFAHLFEAYWRAAD
jgi:hypothetical protein